MRTLLLVLGLIGVGIWPEEEGLLDFSNPLHPPLHSDSADSEKDGRYSLLLTNLKWINQEISVLTDYLVGPLISYELATSHPSSV